MAREDLQRIHCTGPQCTLWRSHMGACLRQITVFRDLTDAQAVALRRLARPTDVVAGAALFSAGDPATDILLVVRGLVKVVRRDASGREHIVRLLRTGDHFGAEYLFASATLPVAAESLAPGHVCFVPLGAVEDLIAADSGLAVRIITAMSRQLRLAEESAAKLALADAGSRLAALLLNLADEIGRPAGGGRTYIHLPINRSDLASLAGIAPETVSRRLGELSETGLITLHGHRGVTLLDYPRLEALAGRL